ncbi:MAG TPA: hypothetical protein VG496_10100 [Myxococcales bacterium]|nr:hypothetical protein [Myxococcales bacterium]
MFETLIRTAPDGSPIGVLANRFEILAPSRWRVKLRDGASFTDGSPVTADDVRTSLAADNVDVREEDSGLLIESRSEAPLETILRLAFVYKHVAGTYVGSGAFQIAEQTAERVLLRRVRPAPGKIGEIVLMAYGTPRDTFAHMLAGDAELTVLQDGKQAEFFRGVDRVRIIHSPATNGLGVAMGRKRMNRSLRKAVAAEIAGADLGTVFGDQCRPFPKPTADTSQRLPRLDVNYLQNDFPFEQMALALARALGPSLGELRPLSATTAFTLLKSQDFDLMILRPAVWPANDMATVWGSGSQYNLSGYSNPRVDAALRAADWARALQELQEDPPVVFICRPERFAAVDSRIKNPQLGPWDIFETLPDWEVAE